MPQAHQHAIVSVLTIHLMQETAAGALHSIAFGFFKINRKAMELATWPFAKALSREFTRINANKIKICKAIKSGQRPVRA